MFDSIIKFVMDRYGMNRSVAGAFIASLLSMMVDSKNGGFGGFLDKLRGAGLGDAVASWISRGDNAPLSDAQVESALGRSAIDQLAGKAGLDTGATTGALGAVIPRIVDELTPDGSVPANESILSRIKGFLTEWGATIAGGVGAATAATGATARETRDRVTTDRYDRVEDRTDEGGSFLKWLIPLLLLGLLLALAYMFCGRTTPTSNVTVNVNANRVNTNANTNVRTNESSVSISAAGGKYTVTGVVPDEATKKQIVDAMTAQYGAANVNFDGLKVDATAKPLGTGWWDNFSKMLPNLKDWKDGTLTFAGNAITAAAGLPAAAMDQLKSLFSGWTLPGVATADANANRTLTEVTLPDGKKLRAYPGGIEDQLIKFIGSDYKAATDEQLKDRWFNFDDLNFKFNSTELEDSSQRQLDNIVAILKANPDVKIKIGGYTDKKGDDNANLKLSDGRAKAVQTALKAAGVGAQVPEAEGYGEQFATVPESASDAERAPDRKTSVRLFKGTATGSTATANTAAPANANANANANTRR